MREGLLEWFGSVLNFIVLIYIIAGLVGTMCFDATQSIIASLALAISVIIQLYTSISKLRR